MPRSLHIDVPPLSPASTRSCSSLPSPNLNSPIAFDSEDELELADVFPDVALSYSNAHHALALSRSIPARPSNPLSVPPKPKLSSLESRITAPNPNSADSDGLKHAGAGAGAIRPEYMTMTPHLPSQRHSSVEASKSRSLPTDTPIRTMSSRDRKLGHTRSPSGGRAPLRLQPSYPRPGSTIAFAHAPLPAPIPPSLIRRWSSSSCSPPPNYRISTSPTKSPNTSPKTSPKTKTSSRRCGA
ncbi:uncharacterized protein CcaverHIS019_0300580 [Cutaneotrichosporon cavernicola]|uniref:Uncharacterized protein n=1 Tax=Cutaneotrichosporon cavernicola TaxID=279322 RepID=A0AA48IIU0_9TREE|nr:uncharacterized protein CcaverHIS019_0300580 [Cutaneotrichosporon cavernicola]BEI89988.1 hypothetical protein CcaverHIS019_0300580 [Cutaneotrichosporon cavernicola]BEI97760.1 hypothetical protein CcaverHIS631_0300590 [Cutaneotrichosporon cavernicola]BEJ05538.1 hypothetical protein CcaverHIS641_0300600 [Cutaneotrichosporon cavernicola]